MDSRKERNKSAQSCQSCAESGEDDALAALSIVDTDDEFINVKNKTHFHKSSNMGALGSMNPPPSIPISLLLAP